MKLIDTKNNKFVDRNPKTLEAGTPIPASSMNAIQDEISNVITGYGLAIDETNDSQMKEALESHFAPINSPSLTGIPLTVNPDGNTDNQIATVAYVKQYGTETSLGYQAVQQGGGTSMGSNKIYMGADSSDPGSVRVQIDSYVKGKLVFQVEDQYTYGVDAVGFNIAGQTLAFHETGKGQWHFCYTSDQIDAKSYIPSLPTGNNQKITNIIWNTSSNLPAYYYGSNNTVSYSATTDWVNSTINSDITLSQQYHFRTDGYTAFYRQASDANAGIIDLYSNYNGNNNNVFRIASDGSIYTLSGGSINLNNPYATSGNSGDYNASPAVEFQMSGRGAYATLRYEESVGRTNQFTLAMPSFSNNSGNTTYFWFDGPSGRINSSFGEFAFISDLNNVQSNLQNQINGKQAAGSYVTSDQYASDFSTGDSRVINLAYSHRIQCFQANVGDGTTAGSWITFPQAFSGTPVFYQANSNGNGDGVTDTDYWCYGANSTGMYVRPRNHQGSANIIVIGPK